MVHGRRTRSLLILVVISCASSATMAQTSGDAWTGHVVPFRAQVTNLENKCTAMAADLNTLRTEFQSLRTELRDESGTYPGRLLGAVGQWAFWSLSMNFVFFGCWIWNRFHHGKGFTFNESVTRF